MGLIMGHDIQKVLVDKRNIAELYDTIITNISSASLIGIDTETHNENAHQGILDFRKSDTTKVSDYRRMVMTGFSIYPETSNGTKCAYYFNLNHSDKENRLSWDDVVGILNSKRYGIPWIAHNAVYELMVFKSCYDYDLYTIHNSCICTMQMAVSAWGPDEYNHEDFKRANFGDIKSLFPEIEPLFMDGVTSDTIDDYYNINSLDGSDDDAPEPEVTTNSNSSSKFTFRQQEYLNKVLGKQSKASFSYNGLVKSIAYTYGLKRIVERFFNYKMTTYEELLQSCNATHMGELTGDQTVAYGADDAYWAIQVFYKIYEYMKNTNPAVINTFFDQENPMIKVYADTKLSGMRVNFEAVKSRRQLERVNFAQRLRDLKAVINRLLPFPSEYNEKLIKYEPRWYGKEPDKYRSKFINWATSPDSTDDFKQACQVSNAVSNAWSGIKNPGISISHYYQVRLMMYDLCRMVPIIMKGKVQSDAESRGTLKDKIKALLDSTADEGELIRLNNCISLLDLINEIASIEQRMKLYLTPYTMLTDPDTGRMYPELSAMLATRRMSCVNPNAQQLAKRGLSTYVRGFFLADSDDEVLVSLDWSQVELVLVGEFSGDPEFAKAYGQIPYEDLHLGAAADVLSVVIDGVDVDLLTNIHTMPIEKIPPKLLIKPNGEQLSPAKAKKYWRTEVGKGSNFNYWYSGALSTVGDKLGWTADQMWKATEKFRERFEVAERWRLSVIEFARENGYVDLPDGHRRVRWEATYDWTTTINQMLTPYLTQGLRGINKFMQEVMRATRTRAGNQVVNAKIQGTSATLTKRSILRINQALSERTDITARFKLAVHDELIFSVKATDVVEFIKLAKSIMMNHPDIVSKLKLYCTASVGKTFEPYDGSSGNFGQIELDECPAIPCVPKEFHGGVVPEEYIPSVVDWVQKGYILNEDNKV